MEKTPNSELLLKYAAHQKIASQVLTSHQQQTLYCLRRSVVPMPCPHCLTPVSKVDCSGVELDEYDPDGYTRYEYACPVCNTPLVEVITFQGQEFWRRKESAVPGLK